MLLKKSKNKNRKNINHEKRKRRKDGFESSKYNKHKHMYWTSKKISI